MKNTVFIAAVMLIAALMNLGTSAQEVRVGLSVSDNVIKNENVSVGFSLDGTFYNCSTFRSENGFRVEEGNYTEKDTLVYASYEQASAACLENEVPLLRSMGNWAVSVSGGSSVLCVYSEDELLFAFKGQHPLRFEPADESYIELSSGSYRGSIEYDINMKTINAIDINEYLYSVVASEMPSQWHEEALKAQAVCARSYAYFSRHNHENEGFELCDTSHCQLYGGMKNETQNSIDAVEATKDEYIFYDDEIINAVFHSSSGGYTDSSYNVWSVYYPYLVPVPDTYDTEGKTWSHTYSLNSLSDETTGQVTEVILKIDSETKRVSEMTLKGTKQDKVISGKNIRSFLPEMESTLFNFSQPSLSSSSNVVYAADQNGISPLEDLSALSSDEVFVISSQETEKVYGNEIFILSADGAKALSESENTYIYTSSSSPNIIFYGRGWGHGAGMSQFGAKGMAENGFDYEQILAHYYTGTEVKKLRGEK